MTSSQRSMPACARELVRAVGAVARVGGAEVVVPGVDAPQQSPARSDDLGLVLDDVAVELDLVERAAGPVGEVARARHAWMPARHGSGSVWTHAPGAAVGQRPGEAGEDAGAVGAQELVRVHVRFHSRKAVSSLSRVSGGTSSSVIRPTVEIVVRIWSRYQSQPSQKLMCCSKRDVSSGCERLVEVVVDELDDLLAADVLVVSHRGASRARLRTFERARCRSTRWLPSETSSASQTSSRVAALDVAHRDHDALRRRKLRGSWRARRRASRARRAPPRGAAASCRDRPASGRGRGHRRHGSARARRPPHRPRAPATRRGRSGPRARRASWRC